MGVSKIEQLIEDIYEFVESCKMQPLSSTKVIVPKDELYDLLDELRLRTPDEIKRYQKILNQRDAILADAKGKADLIMREAEEKMLSLVEEHEIMQQAYNQANDVVNQAMEEANRILEEANSDADQIRTGALAYTNEMLVDLENILLNAYDSTKSKYDSILESLKGNLDIVINNKKELGLQTQEQVTRMEYEENMPAEMQEEEFDFDENAFLEEAGISEEQER